MAMLQDPKLEALENRYLQGEAFHNGDYFFTLTLNKLEHMPFTILEYDWTVILEDDTAFLASMKPALLGNPSTRLEQIKMRLKSLGKDTDDGLANAINDEIDEIYKKYR